MQRKSSLFRNPSETNLHLMSLYGIIKRQELGMQLDIAHDIKPVSYVKSHTADMLKYLEEKQSPIIITQNGEAKAVMLDVESYQEIMNTMTMMKLIRMSEKDIEDGHVYSSEDVFSHIKNELLK